MVATVGVTYVASAAVTLVALQVFPQGERVEVLLNATTRVDASGAIVGVVGVGQDITEITKSQAELSRVASDFRLLIETANAPIFGTSADGTVNIWNSKMAEVSGVMADTVIGSHLWQHPCIAPICRGALRSFLAEGLRGNEQASSREQGVIRASLAGLKGSERDKTGSRNLFKLFGCVP